MKQRHINQFQLNTKQQSTINSNKEMKEYVREENKELKQFIVVRSLPLIYIHFEALSTNINLAADITERFSHSTAFHNDLSQIIELHFIIGFNAH